MARMKIEVNAARARAGELSAKDRLVAYLPRYAIRARYAAPLLNLGLKIPGVPAATERALGFSARRSLPKWHARPWEERGRPASPDHVLGDGRDIVLFGDTFNRYFEPENLGAAERVLEAAGYRLHRARPFGRPLCCGRTFLAAGLVEEARTEARRTLEAVGPLIERGARIVGLEPSCLLTFRDEMGALLPDLATQEIAASALLFEELLSADAEAGRLTLPLKAVTRTAHLHGHCHQKAFGAMGSVETALRLVPGLEVKTIESSCCGMAGSFGYEPEHIEVSLAMAELSLLPAVRAAAPDDLVVADGTSCRHQIKDGAGREAVHVARVLAEALA